MQTPRQVATSQTYPGRAKYGSRESRLECIENPFLWRARKPHASALSSGCDAHDQQVRHAPWDRGAQESRSLLVGHRYRYPFGTPKRAGDEDSARARTRTADGRNALYCTCILILLRHRIGVAWVVLRGALQHGHRARVVARATIRCRRIVAIELATCRSGRTGGASGWTILGNLRRRELIGGVAGG